MKTDSLRTDLGHSIHLNEWTIPQPKADIILSHGFQEHSGRYAKEAEFFNNHGFNFLAYDLRAHGQSSGQPRAYISDFSLHSIGVILVR